MIMRSDFYRKSRITVDLYVNQNHFHKMHTVEGLCITKGVKKEISIYGFFLLPALLFCIDTTYPPGPKTHPPGKILL